MIALLFYLLNQVASAVEPLQPTHPNQLLIGTTREVGHRVTSARVVAFNRSGLEMIFPDLAGHSDAWVKRWLLDECAFVNTNQFLLTGIRSEFIPRDRSQRKAMFIQPGAGRSGDLRVSNRMLNLKASGITRWNHHEILRMRCFANAGRSREARLIDHASGLETFYMSTAEYIRSFVIQDRFDDLVGKGQPERDAVGALALIDWGFDILAADERLRAFGILREASVGRATTDDPTPMIYTDHGFFQETYSGARVDFGGARLSSEVRRSLDDRAKMLGPDEMDAFVRHHLMGHEKLRPMRSSRPVDWTILARSPVELERSVEPAAIGRSGDLFWENERGDSIEVAQFKMSLFDLSPEDLNLRLADLSHAHVITLLRTVRGPLKIPLPEAAYHHALDRGGKVAAIAVESALHVLTRYPALHGPVQKQILTRLNAPLDHESDRIENARRWLHILALVDHPRRRAAQLRCGGLLDTSTAPR